MRYMKPVSLYKDFLKLQPVKPWRLVGFNVYETSVALSLSLVDNKDALPLTELVREKDNIGLIADDFRTVMSEYSVPAFVVGYPYDKEKYTPEDRMLVKEFIDNLRETGMLKDVRFTYWPNDYIEQIATRLLRPVFDPVESKGLIDKVGTAMMLQYYLDRIGRVDREDLDKGK